MAIAEGLELPRSEVFRARGWLLSEEEKESERVAKTMAKALREQVEA